MAAISIINVGIFPLCKYLLLAAKTALTAHTGSRVSPTRKVMSHNSGIEARNLISWEDKSTQQGFVSRYLLPQLDQLYSQRWRCHQSPQDIIPVTLLMAESWAPSIVAACWVLAAGTRAGCVLLCSNTRRQRDTRDTEGGGASSEWVQLVATHTFHLHNSYTIE